MGVCASCDPVVLEEQAEITKVLEGWKCQWLSGPFPKDCGKRLADICDPAMYRDVVKVLAKCLDDPTFVSKVLDDVCVPLRTHLEDNELFCRWATPLSTSVADSPPAASLQLPKGSPGRSQ